MQAKAANEAHKNHSAAQQKTELGDLKSELDVLRNQVQEHTQKGADLRQQIQEQSQVGREQGGSTESEQANFADGMKGDEGGSDVNVEIMQVPQSHPAAFH